MANKAADTLNYKPELGFCSLSNIPHINCAIDPVALVMCIQTMIPSLIEAWRVILNPVETYIPGRVCMTILLTSSNQRCGRRTLPREPGLSPISRDVIGLVSHFGSIIVITTKHALFIPPVQNVANSIGSGPTMSTGQFGDVYLGRL